MIIEIEKGMLILSVIFFLLLIGILIITVFVMLKLLGSGKTKDTNPVTLPPVALAGFLAIVIIVGINWIIENIKGIVDLPKEIGTIFAFLFLMYIIKGLVISEFLPIGVEKWKCAMWVTFFCFFVIYFYCLLLKYLGGFDFPWFPFSILFYSILHYSTLHYTTLH